MVKLPSFEYLRRTIADPKVRELASLRESYAQHWQEMSDKEQADTLVEIRELEKAVSY